MEPMNFGVIGCGGFCRGNHLPNLAANPKCRIRALCDLNPEILEELESKYKPDYTAADFERVMSDPGIDAVVCATKAEARLPIMEAAVKYHKPLFVEKPLASGMPDALKMLELMRDFALPFMVGFNRPFSPMMNDASRYYRKYCGSGNTTILYRIIGEARLWPRSHYHAVVGLKESTIIHEATHIFNLLNFLTGAFPRSVYTAGGGNMDNVITLEYPDNVTAVIIAGDNSNAGFPKEYLEINGAYTTIAGYNFAELKVFGGDGQFFNHRYPYRVGQDTFVTGREEMEERLCGFRENITAEDMEYGYYYDKQVQVDKGHYNELEAFRRCIAGGEKSPVDVYQGAAANLTARAALESWEKGSKIPLEDAFYNFPTE